MNLDKYYTEDKDYTGCNPVVKEALMTGKNIVCYVPQRNENLTIVDYIGTPLFAYITDRGVRYSVVYPVEKQYYFKPAHEIVKWCIDNGWCPAPHKDVLFIEPGEPFHRLTSYTIKHYGNKKYNSGEFKGYVHPEWLTTKEK